MTKHNCGGKVSEKKEGCKVWERIYKCMTPIWLRNTDLRRGYMSSGWGKWLRNLGVRLQNLRQPLLHWGVVSILSDYRCYAFSFYAPCVRKCCLLFYLLLQHPKVFPASCYSLGLIQKSLAFLLIPIKRTRHISSLNVKKSATFSRYSRYTEATIK
jgi:hypothetical protein